jgi:hypothetical protein
MITTSQHLGLIIFLLCIFMIILIVLSDWD